MRSAYLMGRAFNLRDRGRLDEALAVCREALSIATDPRAGADSSVCLSEIVAGALTVDEIASRLGTPDIARSPLEEALRRFESFKRGSIRPLQPDRDQLLINTELRIRQRLEELGRTER